MLNQGRHQICVNSQFLDGCSQISANSPDYFMARDLAMEIGEITKDARDMTPNEELFATYYNRGKILVKDMNDVELRELREQLRKIATEAKAQLMAADDEIRERDAKSGAGKAWLVSVDTETSVSDAINVPKQRAARMSKMDKIKQQLLGTLDEETVNEMVKNLSKRATDKNLKTVTFTKKTTETGAVQVKQKPESNGEPFDPSKLKFGGQK